MLAAHTFLILFNFFQDTIKVVKKFMERDPDELNFTLMALVKNE